MIWITQDNKQFQDNLNESVCKHLCLAKQKSLKLKIEWYTNWSDNFSVYVDIIPVVSLDHSVFIVKHIFKLDVDQNILRPLIYFMFKTKILKLFIIPKFKKHTEQCSLQ